MIVEKAFDLNDWVVLFSICIIWIGFFFLPKPFSRQTIVLVMLYGVTVASVFDNSFGAKAFDFYDIMDGPVYDLMDFFVYFLYPPFAYAFIYFHRKLNIRSYKLVLYILIWSMLSAAVEFILSKANVFTYKNGYSIYYSFCIYLTIQTGLYYFFKSITNDGWYKSWV
ncbi:hypothetical protein RCG23_22805 [Neobacillus sp. PS3-34]|uniref:hypothetical protein n=1 Tax=Neobacillus sp. PS3-34 TaxID=3070678 RepID=UPI0027E0BAB8|nr:hypothetical protein [Neobacillus sp. PS3-34]WML48083.1 hypothetical protein RCG23_22805 [Neobacillus sp. PS3-34]